jgi:putative PIN family toxin of toxin-antitoxin system
MKRVVLDTNVIVAAGRSRQGASHALLRLLAEEAYRPVLSVPLVLEYEMALRRRTELDQTTAVAIVDFLCLVGERQPIYYLWRPFLKDPGDEMVLEVAVGAAAEAVVTHNIRDFDGVEENFGIRVITPREFLAELKETDP